MVNRTTFVSVSDGDRIKRDNLGRFRKGTCTWKGYTKENNISLKKKGLNQSGINSWNWKGGKVKHPSGAIKISNNGKQYWEHHYIWCINNGIPIIPKDCEIHHIDLNPSNNIPENLILLSKKTHRQLHYQIQLLQNPDRIFFGKNQNLRGN